jgi:hypothetical protein
MPIQFEAKLPRKLPETLNVYALDKPKVTNASLTDLAKKLGLTGQGRDFISSSDSLGYTEGRWGLEVNRVSGAVSYTHLDSYGIETEKAFDLSDARADGVARRFLDRAALYPRATIQLRRVTHLRGAHADLENRKVTEKLLDAGVIYGRVVDDQPVDGPGGFSMVHIDPAAEVVGMRSVWRPLGKRLGKVKIKPPEEAMEGLRKRAEKFRGDTTVVKATFGYFELGPIDSQTSIEPVYAFVYVVRDGEVAMKSAYVAHAGDKTFGNLLGKRRFDRGAQRARRQ